MFTICQAYGLKIMAKKNFIRFLSYSVIAPIGGGLIK